MTPHEHHLLRAIEQTLCAGAYEASTQNEGRNLLDGVELSLLPDQPSTSFVLRLCASTERYGVHKLRFCVKEIRAEQAEYAEACLAAVAARRAPHVAPRVVAELLDAVGPEKEETYTSVAAYLRDYLLHSDAWRTTGDANSPAVARILRLCCVRPVKQVRPQLPPGTFATSVARLSGIPASGGGDARPEATNVVALFTEYLTSPGRYAHHGDAVLPFLFELAAAPLEATLQEQLLVFATAEQRCRGANRTHWVAFPQLDDPFTLQCALNPTRYVREEPQMRGPTATTAESLGRLAARLVVERLRAGQNALVQAFGRLLMGTPAVVYLLQEIYDGALTTQNEVLRLCTFSFATTQELLLPALRTRVSPETLGVVLRGLEQRPWPVFRHRSVVPLECAQAWYTHWRVATPDVVLPALLVPYLLGAGGGDALDAQVVEDVRHGRFDGSWYQVAPALLREYTDEALPSPQLCDRVEAVWQTVIDRTTAPALHERLNRLLRRLADEAEPAAPQAPAGARVAGLFGRLFQSLTTRADRNVQNLADLVEAVHQEDFVALAAWVWVAERGGGEQDGLKERLRRVFLPAASLDAKIHDGATSNPAGEFHRGAPRLREAWVRCAAFLHSHGGDRGILADIDKYLEDNPVAVLPVELLNWRLRPVEHGNAGPAWVPSGQVTFGRLWRAYRQTAAEALPPHDATCIAVGIPANPRLLNAPDPYTRSTFLWDALSVLDHADAAGDCHGAAHARRWVATLLSHGSSADAPVPAAGTTPAHAFPLRVSPSGPETFVCACANGDETAAKSSDAPPRTPPQGGTKRRQTEDIDGGPTHANKRPRLSSLFTDETSSVLLHLLTQTSTTLTLRRRAELLTEKFNQRTNLNLSFRQVYNRINNMRRSGTWRSRVERAFRGEDQKESNDPVE